MPETSCSTPHISWPASLTTRLDWRQRRRKTLHGPRERRQRDAEPLLPSWTLCASMRALLRIHTYTVAISFSCFVSLSLLFYTFRSGAGGEDPSDVNDVGSFFSNYKKVKHLENVVKTLQSKLSEAQAYENELLTKIDELQEQVNSEHASTIQVRGLEAQSGWAGVGETAGAGAAAASGHRATQIYSCRHTDSIKVGKTIGQGHTKVVQEGTLLGRKVAVKSTSMQVKNVKDCLQQGIYKKKEDCLILAMYKVLKEAMILRQVRHPNVIKLLGLCARSENGSPNIRERGVTLVVELGSPVHLHELVEMPWQTRVKLCMDMGNLLQFLENSPMGSTAISDFRDEQFVLVDGVLVLADVDDLSSTEPDCDKNLQCLVDGKSVVKCASNMKCGGLNAHLNLQRAYDVFIGPLLSHQVPAPLQAATRRLLKSLRRGDLDAEGMVYRLKNLQSVP
ncbi:extracellular tyrosine-protein kinase PKDCC-like [Diadema setosum]|uniref:extracellular tyrosine-protein kinase PKDCC-like n=1 Tax=Diadema setosum TaxID=31175 RepID=UPI003B3BDF9B